MSNRRIWISFPTAPYTQESAERAARSVLQQRGWRVDVQEGDVAEADVPKSRAADAEEGVDVYLADYDLLPFEQVHPAGAEHAGTSAGVAYPQLSSYVIRKALIRKNYLAHSLHVARIKGQSSQNNGANRVDLATHGDDRQITPQTWTFEATSVDDLDELLTDDLYDVRQDLEENEAKEEGERTWYILKPAMADQGMGIRLFDSVQGLEDIFNEFEGEESSDEEEEEEDEGREEAVRKHSSATAIVTSQVRQFVIQKYLSRPLLVQPPSLSSLHKFHIRAYVMAQASLRVFLFDEMLALFAPSPYAPPHNATEEDQPIDLSSHLTNTSRQNDEQSGQTVHLLSDLLDSPTNLGDGQRLSRSHLDLIRARTAGVIAETFVACTQAGRVHFQTWPNAWEIFGVDLMVTVQDDNDLRLWLLEVNAQPDFAKSGSRLQEKIDKLFRRSLEICTLGLDSSETDAERTSSSWKAGESRDQMTLCLDTPLSAGGW